ncbi:hypothetical protein [Sphingomonas xanthus]|uniref:Uncharacterized protein n=1 Tax=Sphingomonas xanthus TaxID=2594473 RepID=A0A516ISK3_9SPHN|nr:hypothetical protein [Sphingomonas xanthus]QDP19876.1 hypothetical protein FMM02_07840 [Sphingomonas xanthus]
MMVTFVRAGRGRIRLIAWVAASALILGPLAALKAADPTAWAIEDLPFALLMVLAVGGALECAVHIPRRLAYRAGLALAVGPMALLTLGNLAVGFAGSEENAINALFFIVPLIAVLGAVMGGFRSRSLAVTMLAAATVQLALGIYAFVHGYFTGPLTVAFTSLWLASALLFRRAT